MSTSQQKAEAAKQAKQKKILAVTSVIFLALVGFQLPKLMGGGGSQAAPPPTSTVAGLDGAAAVPSATPSATPLAPGVLPDTDRVVVERGSDQLVSFGLFKSKDPFVQQIGANAGGVAPTPTPIPAPPIVNTTAPLVTTPTPAPTVPPRRTAPNGGLTPVTTTTPVLTTPSVVSPPTTPVTPSVAPQSTPPRTTTPATTTPAVAPTSVSISTNGVCEVVSKDGTFPGDEDIFKVVSIAKDGKSAKITVVGGAYDSGAASVTLELGKKLTLVNTADGTRYVLVLQAKCNVETQTVGGAVTTPATSTVAPPATTSTVTTPIVTDALDTTTPGQ